MEIFNNLNFKNKIILATNLMNSILSKMFSIFWLKLAVLN